MRPPLVLIPQFFGSLIFDRRNSRYYPFDHETTALFLRLRREPLEAIADGPGIRDFYDYFYREGYFDLKGRFAGTVLEAKPPADHMLGPLAVHLEIVASCNLACSHCFAGELPRKDTPLTTNELDSLFASLARMGSFRLGLTGGEPLLRRDLFDVIDLATHHGLHPCLTTNGLLIDERIALEFAKRDLGLLNVSLDGSTAETNDRIRGAGTFKRVLEKLEILRRHARFTIAFTITSMIVDEVEACADLAERLGAHAAVFRPLYPVGIAAQHLELMPTFSQYTAALTKLSGDIHGIDAFSPQLRQDTQARVTLNEGCGAGNLVCSISVKGDVNPCSFLGPELNAADIREQPFEEIWHSSSGFRQIRNLPGGQGCFAGGCRARAQAFNGSINAPDPWHQEFKGGLHPMSNIEYGRSSVS